jgi:sec-independent protein translocase protein TatA
MSPLLLMSLTPLFGPIPGGMEMMIILLIAVLLFGANKLPKLARSTGQAMGEFKKGREDIEREIRESAEPVEHGAPEVESHDDETTNV